eukprot:scaffold156249_cov52-Attheya_sp.AAC.3
MACGKEWGGLAQGDNKTGAKGTDTFNLLRPDQVKDIPKDRTVTYTNIVVDYRAQKEDPNRVRITAAGNLVEYPGELTTHTADITTSKMLWNSAGKLANEYLRKKIAPHGYYEVKHTPGLWKHVTRPIIFTLTVDDFGVKYVGKRHAQHLLRILESQFSAVSTDWTGELYCGITLDWNYEEGWVDISMPG